MSIQIPTSIKRVRQHVNVLLGRSESSATDPDLENRIKSVKQTFEHVAKFRSLISGMVQPENLKSEKLSNEMMQAAAEMGQGNAYGDALKVFAQALKENGAAEKLYIGAVNKNVLEPQKTLGDKANQFSNEVDEMMKKKMEMDDRINTVKRKADNRNLDDDQKYKTKKDAYDHQTEVVRKLVTELEILKEQHVAVLTEFIKAQKEFYENVLANVGNLLQNLD